MRVVPINYCSENFRATWESQYGIFESRNSAAVHQPALLAVPADQDHSEPPFVCSDNFRAATWESPYGIFESRNSAAIQGRSFVPFSMLPCQRGACEIQNWGWRVAGVAMHLFPETNRAWLDDTIVAYSSCCFVIVDAYYIDPKKFKRDKQHFLFRGRVVWATNNNVTTGQVLLLAPWATKTHKAQSHESHRMYMEGATSDDSWGAHCQKVTIQINPARVFKFRLLFASLYHGELMLLWPAMLHSYRGVV